MEDQEELKLSSGEAKIKLEERTVLVEKLIKSIAQVFENEIPCTIMETEEAPVIIHNTILNFLMRISHSLGYDKNTIIAHINMFFNEAEGKQSN